MSTHLVMAVPLASPRPPVARHLVLLLLAAVSVAGCAKARIVDPWGVVRGADLVREVQEEEAGERKAKVAEDMRASLCATSDGRNAVAMEAARSPSDDIEPCPEPR